jgi:hypothetical protein
MASGRGRQPLPRKLVAVPCAARPLICEAETQGSPVPGRLSSESLSQRSSAADMILICGFNPQLLDRLEEGVVHAHNGALQTDVSAHQY